MRPGEARMNLGLTCDYCNEVFNSDYRAKNHYKSKHPGRESYNIEWWENVYENMGQFCDKSSNLVFEYL